MRLRRDSNGGRCLILGRSSGWKVKYHFIWAFEAHDIDGVGRDADEDESHGVEV